VKQRLSDGSAHPIFFTLCIWFLVYNKQRKFLLSLPIFYFRLSLAGLSEGRERLRILERDRPADFGVVCAAFGLVVLDQSPFEVVGTADVERVVGAFEDIYVVEHRI
jgi:hypothetical protein